MKKNGEIKIYNNIQKKRKGDPNRKRGADKKPRKKYVYDSTKKNAKILLNSFNDERKLQLIYSYMQGINNQNQLANYES